MSLSEDEEFGTMQVKRMIAIVEVRNDEVDDLDTGCLNDEFAVRVKGEIVNKGA